MAWAMLVPGWKYSFIRAMPWTFFDLDVVDAVDVEEVVLVVVGEQALHLRRVHAAVRLGDVDDRQIQVGKDVDRHPRHGQQAAERDGDHGDHHGVTAAAWRRRSGSETSSPEAPLHQSPAFIVTTYY